MIDASAAMRAWLDAHDLGDGELLHQLPNQGPEGADRMTDPERLVLSALLEGRRAVVPGYQATPTNPPAPSSLRWWCRHDDPNLPQMRLARRHERVDVPTLRRTSLRAREAPVGRGGSCFEGPP